MAPHLVSAASSGHLQGEQRRLVYITLEYCHDDLFSGNGICSRSQVHGLAKLLPHWTLEVICARPHDAPLHPSDAPLPNIRVHVVPVSTWKTTDRYFQHEIFGWGVQERLGSLLGSSSDDEPPLAAILAIDWTGMAGLLGLMSAPKIPIFFLNFRVYARMTNISEEDRSFYLERERKAVHQALQSGGAIMALSPSDGQALQDMATTKDMELEHRFRVILPMLRNDILEMAERDREAILDTHRHRPYFACIVRLSRDKGPQRFVETCRIITQQDPTFWKRTRTIPVLAGAASQPDFAAQLQQIFYEAVPEALVISDFMDATKLSQLLQQTRLNLHPALYEAFGMTIVEAAACGAPTLLSNQPGSIGAQELISLDANRAFGVDLQDSNALAKRVMELLESPSDTLAVTGHKAYHAAITWTEREHCQMLWTMVSDRLEKNDYSIIT